MEKMKINETMLRITDIKHYFMAHADDKARTAWINKCFLSLLISTNLHKNNTIKFPSPGCDVVQV